MLTFVNAILEKVAVISQLIQQNYIDLHKVKSY